jgi:hypothetical protein
MALPMSPVFKLEDAQRPGVTHALELYEQGGEIFLRVTLEPPNGAEQAYRHDGSLYTANISASLRLSPHDLKGVEEGIAKSRRRTGA